MVLLFEKIKQCLEKAEWETRPPPPYFRTPPLILLTKENSNRKNQSIAALSGVGFVKQRAGEEEPKEVWGAGPAMTVVEVTGAWVGGHPFKQHLGGGSTCSQSSSSTRWAPIRTTSRRGVDLFSFFLICQGGAQDSQNSWRLRSDHDGGSGGHLLGQRRMQVREKATGDLLVFILVKNSPSAFTFVWKWKFFYHFLCRFVITCAVLEKDPMGPKVLERCN